TLAAQCAPAATPEVIEKQVTVEVEKIVKETVVVEKAVTPETVTVEWWPGWPNPAMVAIAKLFQDQHPGVNIKAVTTYPDMAGTLAAIASGTPPDIIADVPYLELIVRGVCVPLDDYIAASQVVSLTDGDIRKEHWEVFAWEGKHYGVPAVDTAGREGMGYNLDLIEKAGLDPEKLPQTWDEVFDWHKKITTYDAAGNLEILGMNPMAERLDAASYGDPWVLPQIWGFHYYNADEKKYEIDRPETIEFLNVIKKFSDDVGVEKMDGMTKALNSIARDAFGAGKAAMRVTYPSAAGAVWQVNPTATYKFTWVPVPASRKGKKVQSLSGHAYIILKDAKQPDVAFQLAEFMTTKEVCDILFEEIGWLGPRKSWQQSVDMSKYPEPVQENIRFFTTSLDEADELWSERDPIESITQDQWNNVWQGVTFGKITPEEAAKDMQAKLTEELQAALGG
ncbi:MAG: extracellular solute-binding protein, partial [Chloroflexi bacterium]|nr:extracellular solute-binding protein [Chloroflexota bacterium]